MNHFQQMDGDHIAPPAAGWPAPCPGVQCGLADLLRWTGKAASAQAQVQAEPDVRFSLRRLHAGAALFHTGAPFDNLYVVAAGSFKCHQLDLDGYEQALGFAMRADILGMDALWLDRHPTSATALEDGAVAVIPRADLPRLNREHPLLQQLLLECAGRELRDRNAALSQMAATAAEVRLARFLLQWSERLGRIGLSTRRLRLCMGRRDIASLLGVAHETVSRSFTALSDWGYINVLQREVVILDHIGLLEFQRHTRGVVDVGRERERCAARPAPPRTHAPSPAPQAALQIG